MRILIKNVTVVDPPRPSLVRDVMVQGSLISSVADVSDDHASLSETDRIIDGTGLILTPGLIDIHVHLREPGQEYKETIETGLKAAAKGGFTAVCCMPNTTPVNDNAQVTAFILSQAEKVRGARVYPVGAITKGSLGEDLAPVFDMAKAGIRAISDDGLPVANSRLMRRVLEYCKELKLPVLIHAEDKVLAGNSAMNEGPVATRLGIPGIPNASEAVMVARDIELSRLTGTPVHFCHISTAESLSFIAKGKAEGVQVTCETAPHYFTLTDEAITDYNANYKMNPPLRSQKDQKAVMEALANGTIDIIATDHAPHHADEKNMEFDKAAFGIIGLETSLPLSLALVKKGVLTMENLIVKMSKNPAKLLGINNDVAAGNAADLTLIDPKHAYTIDPDSFVSKGRNTPFGGMDVEGKAVMTMVNGEIVYQGELR